MTDLFEIAEQMRTLPPDVRLEALTDFGQRLPPLEEPYASYCAAGLYLVLECRSPVFLFAEQREGLVHMVTDVPREAPVARGFAALLREVFDGRPREYLEEAPRDLLEYLSLKPLLGLQRTYGLNAVYVRLREMAR